MSRRFVNNFLSRSSFTLIELLITVSIISILSVFVIVTLNPTELLKQGRDAQRVSDLATINTAVNLFEVDSPSGSLGTASTTYISIPDPTATSTSLGNQCAGLGLPALPAGWTYHCSASSTYRNADGTGWVPVNFSAISYGSPIGTALPIDPINNASNTYYTYTPGGAWQLTGVPESSKYRTTQANQTTGALTIGSNLSLSPLFNSNGLVGYWKFDEGTGSSAKDSSGNSNDGTWQGTLGSQWTTGKVGGAGNFNGSNNYLSLGNSASLDGTLSSITVVYWGQTLTPQHGGGVFEYRYLYNTAGLNFGNYLYDQYSGGKENCQPQVRFGAYPSQNPNTYGSAGYICNYPSAWNLWAVTRDGTTGIASTYINGIFYGSSTLWASQLASGAGANAIGAQDAYGAQYFYGYIDELRVYNRALSAAEIMALYNATK